jgi:hypothetical protein
LAFRQLVSAAGLVSSELPSDTVWNYEPRLFADRALQPRFRASGTVNAVAIWAGGHLPRGGAPQDYAGLIDAEVTKWRQVVKSSGISLE